MSHIFKLKNTYEIFIEVAGTKRPVRIEILESGQDAGVFRARVWDQNTYNLYPTMANLLPQGGIEHGIFSCDEINREVTTIVADAPEFILGKTYTDENEFLRHIIGLVKTYEKELQG